MNELKAKKGPQPSEDLSEPIAYAILVQFEDGVRVMPCNQELLEDVVSLAGLIDEDTGTIMIMPEILKGVKIQKPT